MDFDANWIADRLLILIPLWFSLGVHECAHAWAARRLGDDTAERLGRLTLNPLAHIDPIGTLLLPLLGVPFGWAKPVPVNPLRFRREVNMRTGMMITAIAGPISNVCLTAISIVALAAVIRFAPQWAVPKHPVVQILVMMMYMNVVLATFNMLPIPPLDGSRIADALIPNAARPLWETYCQLGPFFLVAVIVLPRLQGINLFHWPLQIAGAVLKQMVTLFGG